MPYRRRTIYYKTDFIQNIEDQVLFSINFSLILHYLLLIRNVWKSSPLGKQSLLNNGRLQADLNLNFSFTLRKEERR